MNLLKGVGELSGYFSLRALISKASSFPGYMKSLILTHRKTKYKMMETTATTVAHTSPTKNSPIAPNKDRVEKNIEILIWRASLGNSSK